MAIIYLPLPESYVNITRPVNLNVIDQIVKITGVSHPDFRVSYHGMIETSKTTGSSIGDSNNPERSLFGNSGKFSIDVREEYSEIAQHLGESKVSNRPPIFFDKDLKIYLEPLYHLMETTIEIKYRTPDYNSARAFADHFRTRMDRDSNVLTHELEYEYPMPESSIVILKELHRLREKQGGYGDSWKDWFYSCTANNVDVLTKMDGTGGLVSFKEKQLNVLGWFEEITPPIPQRTTAGEYEITFNYKYRYDRPAEVRFNYPITVHNQLLGKNFRPHWNETSYANMVGTRSVKETLFENIRNRELFWVEDLHGIKLPNFDDRRLVEVPNGTRNLLRALIRVNPAEPTKILNLREIDPYRLSESLLEHLITNRDTVSYKDSDVFYIELLRDGQKMNDSALKLLETGEVVSTFPMDIRATYHLRINLLENLSTLNSKGLVNLVRSPELALSILTSLGIEDHLLPPIIAGKTLNRKDVLSLYPRIKKVTKNLSTLNSAFRGWVGQFVINTRGE